MKWPYDGSMDPLPQKQELNLFHVQLYVERLEKRIEHLEVEIAAFDYWRTSVYQGLEQMRSQMNTVQEGHTALWEQRDKDKIELNARILEFEMKELL